MKKQIKNIVLLFITLFSASIIAQAPTQNECKVEYPNGSINGYNSTYGGYYKVDLETSSTNPMCVVKAYNLIPSMRTIPSPPPDNECNSSSVGQKRTVSSNQGGNVVDTSYECKAVETSPTYWNCEGVNEGRLSRECEFITPTITCSTCSNYNNKCNSAGNGGYNNDVKFLNGSAQWTCGNSVGGCSKALCIVSSPVCSTVIGECQSGNFIGFTSGLNDSVAKWRCESSGIRVSCEKPKPISNAVCGLNNVYRDNFETTSATCQKGTVLSPTKDIYGDVSWTCSADSSTHYFLKGTSSSCTVYKTAECGDDYNTCSGKSSLLEQDKCPTNSLEYCWSCDRNEAGGNVAKCKKNRPVQQIATCGTSHGKTVANRPSSASLCEIGSVANPLTLSDSGKYEWSCFRPAASDVEVDTAVNCSATWVPQCSSITTTFTKQCGGQNINTNFTLPTATSSTQSVSHDAFSCSAINYECQKDMTNEKGVWVKVSDNCTACNSCDCTAAEENFPSGTWSPNYNLFRCVDSTGANPNQVCNGKVTPKCGSTIGSCSTGTFSKWTSTLDASTQTWECVNDGLIASCSGTKINVNVSCGTSQNKSYSSASEINTPAERCSVSNSSYSGSVTSSTPTYSSSDFKFKWNCNAPSDTRQIDWSSSVSCSAFRNPVCASITPSQNIACSVGYASGEYAQGGNRYWKCSNGTATAQECRVERPVYPMAVCGTSNGGSFSNPPTSGLCESGASASVVSDVGTGYSWTCTYPDSNKYIGKTSSCQASKDVACFYDSNNFYQWDGVEEMDCIEDTTEFSYNDGTVSLRADIIYSSGSTSCRYGNGYKLRQFSFDAPWSSGHTVYLYNNIQSSYTKGDGSTIIRVKDSGVEIVGFGTIEGGDNRMFGNRYDICLK